MSEAPDGGGPETRSNGRRFAVLGTIAALLLLVGGFFIGRVSEGESSDETATTSAANNTNAGGDRRGVSTRACGPAAGPDAAEVVKAFPPTIVTDTQIEAEEKGSAGRALLEWWQAYQFSDLVAVEALTSKSTIEAIGADNLAALVRLPGPGLEGIEVLNASERGDAATVNAGLLTFAPDQPGGPLPSEPTNSAPETFAMTNEDGEWRFDQPDFLEVKLGAIQG